MTKALFSVLVLLALPLYGQHDHAAPPPGLAAQEGGYTVIHVPPKDAGADTLEARGQAERANAGKFKVFHGFRFTDRQPGSGITFAHQIVDDAGKTYKAAHYDHGNGVAVADVNGDGMADIFFTSQIGGNELWKNLGDGTFANVTTLAGVGMKDRISVSAAFADVDNDGDQDLYVTTVRMGNLLFENDGKGKFRDITKASGLGYVGHSSGAVFFDYDLDGRLDLFLVNVGKYTTEERGPGGYYIAYENAFQGHMFPERTERSVLYRNLGGNKFADVSEQTGLLDGGWSGDATAADFNEDGWPDLYLANDYGPEEMFLNQEGERFVLSTAGLESESKSGMTVSLGDAFNEGRLDVFVTNISERAYLFQNNNLRLNRMAEEGRFRNVADAAVADAGWAWGAQFGDLNNDGTNELFVANGFISADREQSYWYSMSKIAGANGRLFDDARNWPAFENQSLSGYERSRVFLNRGVGGWVDVAEAVGVQDEYDGRAVALADLSNRGALDVIVANQNQPAVVYRAYPDSANHWIAFALVGTQSNRSAIGAEVVIEAGELRQRRVVDGGMGFASQNDRRLHFGLGRQEWVDRVVIHWPSGEQQVVTRPEVDRFHTIEEPRH